MKISSCPFKLELCTHAIIMRYKKYFKVTWVGQTQPTCVGELIKAVSKSLCVIELSGASDSCNGSNLRKGLSLCMIMRED